MAVFNVHILEDTRNLIKLYNTVPRFKKVVDLALAKDLNRTYKGRPLRLYLEIVTKVSPKYKKYYKGQKTPVETVQECFQKYYEKDFYQLENTLTKGLNTQYTAEEIATIDNIEASPNWKEKRDRYQKHFEQKDNIEVPAATTTMVHETAGQQEENQRLQETPPPPQSSISMTSIRQFLPEISGFGKNIGASITSKGGIALRKGVQIGGGAVAKGGAQLLGKGAAALVGLGTGPIGSFAILLLSSLPGLSKLPDLSVKAVKNTLMITVAGVLAIFILPSLIESQSFFPPFEVAESAPIPGGGSPSGSLGYTIPFRNASVTVVNPEEIKRQVLSSWPSAKLENWDTIVDLSKQHGWNPAFVLTLWIEESGAQGAPNGYSAALGCDINHTKYSGTDINDQLTCLFNNGDFPNEQFADFMCTWGGNSTKAPCAFPDNPNFPNTIKAKYSELVPSGPGALIVLPTPTPSQTYLVSCPVSQGRITCGTYKNIVNNCGHGNGNYGYSSTCNPAQYECTQNGEYPELLKSAIDLVIPNNTILLPTINNKSVRWRRTSLLTLSDGWGIKVFYTTNTTDGRQITINFTHLNNTPVPIEQGSSGDNINAALAPGAPGGPHLHLAMIIDGVPIDAIDAGLCR